jgi:hypothetical protein
MRRIVVALVMALIGAGLVNVGGTASGSPVAMDQQTYETLGRVFPDPHACLTGQGNASPWAKGKVCAADFIQYQEMIDGMAFLEETFPRFTEVYTLHEDFACNGKPAATPDAACEAFRSAGIPQTVTPAGPVTRERLPLKLVRVTDESVPNKGKKYFVFPLSIHGIERAGAEGGTRAAEDLITWGACEAGTAPDFVDCENEDNKAPHPILEPTPKKSLMAGEVLKRSVIYFVWPNPDGWRRGDRTNGTSFYQRYNGNGVDVNRDWPEQGWTYRPYTPWSEPESKSYGKVLQAIGPHDAKGNPKWHGGIDLHGMVDAKAFSFTLLGGTQRPYDKDQRILQTAKGAWRDAEKRLAYSPLIKPNTEPESDPRQYGVQWGTIWDTIDYTVTGAFGNWIDSPMGLNADGLDNEMAFSHLSNCGVGSCFEPDIEQLHVEGNKSLIYSMINYTLKGEDTTFEIKGKVGYLHNRGFIKEASNPLGGKDKYDGLKPQPDINGVQLDTTNEYTYPFDVKGLPKFYNGGIEVVLTCSNVQGVGACGVNTAYLEHKGSVEHPGQSDKEWEVINSYNSPGAGYFQTGQALHANYPAAGKYRIRIESSDPTSIFNADIDFTKEKTWEDPGQVGFKASSMRFWKMLNKFAKPKLTKLTPRNIRRTRSWKKLDTIVITNRVYPKLAKRLKKWVRRKDGNLVLLDRAIKMLLPMGIVPPVTESEERSIKKVGTYAGYVNFATSKREVTYNDKLAKKVVQPGAAEGRGCSVKQSGITRGEACTDADEIHRRQTYEPVPLGYSLEDGGDNSPNWYVVQEVWSKISGPQRAIGTTGAQENVSLGEIKWRGGRIRIFGAVLPDPTKKFDHTFGVGDYALTYTGYQLLQNLLSYKPKP